MHRVVYTLYISCKCANSNHLSMLANLWIRVRVSGQMAVTPGSQSVVAERSRSKEGTWDWRFTGYFKEQYKTGSFIIGRIYVSTWKNNSLKSVWQLYEGNIPPSIYTIFPHRSTGLLQNRQAFALTFTSMENLVSQVNLHVLRLWV